MQSIHSLTLLLIMVLAFYDAERAPSSGARTIRRERTFFQPAVGSASRWRTSPRVAVALRPVGHHASFGGGGTSGRPTVQHMSRTSLGQLDQSRMLAQRARHGRRRFAAPAGGNSLGGRAEGVVYHGRWTEREPVTKSGCRKEGS